MRMVPAATAESAPGGDGGALSFLALEGFSLAVPEHGRHRVLLRNVDLRIPTGGLIVFAGASGGGKSSLLRLLCGLRHPREPRLKVNGRARLLGQGLHRSGTQLPASLRGRVAAVLQEEGLLDELTPRENVELALRSAGRSRRLALALLAQVGLDPPPPSVHVLSGGMRKRVAVARALAAEPEVLLLDEPTAGLDPRGARGLAMLLADTARRSAKRTVLVVTHDLAAFEGLADGLLWLDPAAHRLVFIQTPRGEVLEAAAREQGAADAGAAPAGDERARSGREPGAASGFLPTGRFGDMASALLLTVAHLGWCDQRRVPRELLRCVLAPALFTAAGSAILGGLATFFALRNNPLQGAFQAQVLAGTGKVLAAVLVPLVAGFFYTARVVADAAGRLGAMQRTRQLDALRILGVPPERWLLGPMAWGLVLGMPLVTGAAVVAAAGGSLLAAELAAGVRLYPWAAAFLRDLGPGDLAAVLAKALGSALLVAAITWSIATGPKASGAAVGVAASRAIVVGMAAVLMVHAAGVLAQFL